MPPMLNAKSLSLPRWAWIMVISSGVLLGLYLRSRHAAVTVPASADSGTDSGGGYQDTNQGGSGFVESTGAGRLTPVTTPTLPEGYSDSFAAILGTISDVSGNITNMGRGALKVPYTTGGGPPKKPPVKTTKTFHPGKPHTKDANARDLKRKGQRVRKYQVPTKHRRHRGH